MTNANIPYIPTNMKLFKGNTVVIRLNFRFVLFVLVFHNPNLIYTVYFFLLLFT